MTFNVHATSDADSDADEVTVGGLRFRLIYSAAGIFFRGLDHLHLLSPGSLDDPVGFRRSSLVNVPTNNITDDVVLTKNKHTIQFGGNLRIIVAAASCHSGQCVGD